MHTEFNTHTIRSGALTLATYAVALSLTSPLFAQSNPCEACLGPLKDGVYNHYKDVGLVHKYSSMKDYFKSSDFKQDVKKGSWSGGLTIPVYGVPVSANAGSNHDNSSQFQREIEKLSDNQLDEALAWEIRKSDPNTDFTKQYFDCVEKLCGKGFSYTSERIGKRAFITIHYMPNSITDGMPVLTEDPQIYNASDTSAPKKGQTLDFSTVVNGVPEDVQDAVTVTIQTNKGPYVARSDPPKPTPSPTPSPTPIIVELQVNQSCNGKHAKCDKIWKIAAPGDGQLTVEFTVPAGRQNPTRLHYLINGKELQERDFGFVNRQNVATGSFWACIVSSDSWQG